MTQLSDRKVKVQGHTGSMNIRIGDALLLLLKRSCEMLTLGTLAFSSVTVRFFQRIHIAKLVRGFSSV